MVNAVTRLSNVFHSEDRPLKLPLSCEIVEQGGLIGPPICRGKGHPRLGTCIFKSHSLPSMWLNWLSSVQPARG